MSKIVAITGICAALMCCFSCSSSGTLSKNAPRWVTSPDEVYPASLYLNGVGSGSDRRSAENDAVAVLARSIRQQITAATSASETFAGSNDTGFDTWYDYAGSVDTLSVIKDIPGVGFKEVWVAGNGTVYVLAQLNREETGQYCRSQIEALSSVVESEIVYASGHSGTFEALSALKYAADMATENQEYMDMLAGINPGMYRLVSPDYVNSAAVAVLAAREQEKISVGVAVSGDSDGRIAAAFSRVFADAGIKTVPVVSGLSTGTGNTSRYMLDVSVRVTELDMGGQYDYVRYVLTAALTDTVTGEQLVPYTENGREAHISVAEAAQRSYRTMEQAVAKNYSILLESYLSGLRNKSGS